jgi:hypothetical protein
MLNPRRRSLAFGFPGNQLPLHARHHSLFAQSISFPEGHNFVQGPPIGGRQYLNLRHSGSTYLAQRWTTVLGPERYHPT